ncbi:SAVED domain-containing protein [Arachidicoccus sp.]|uniref:SAVED domain-containing protein n=1 Tax=Arachidicoccus sp. TaxID=1872624 RepID=UPI003D25B355
MSNSVIARQQGDDYQAKYFWYKACKLYQQNSTAVKIAWEKNDSPGFDDVSIFYQPAKLDRTTGKEIHSEYFQVKFHVDHDRGFSCAAFMDPSFIGNTTESLLQRLHKNLKSNPEEFDRSLYHIVNTWGVDHSDEIKNLIDNNGAIRPEKLFDGGGYRSKMGKIRTQWKQHLGISTDDELQVLLSPLRIKHSSKGIDAFTEDLNFRLQAVGLQAISETQRTSVYTDLIQQLHAEKRDIFTKEELLEILKREKLLSQEEKQPEDIYKIGVRSFKRGTDTIAFETDDYLCLLHHFMGRFPINEQLWETDILPSLVTFSEKVIAFGKPLHIHLDTHHSIALALGYCLDSKSGVSTKVIQKTRAGRLLFYADHTSTEYQQRQSDNNWTVSEQIINETGSDLAVAVSVTHDIANDVMDFVQNNVPHTGRFINATIAAGPSPISIRDGNHILLAVLELMKTIKATRNAGEKKGTVHLFVAAPNAFVFTLGQHIKSLGKIILYEYDFEQYRTGSYSQAIQLPIK